MGNDFITADEFAERAIGAAQKTIPKFDNSFGNSKPVWLEMNDYDKAKCIVIMMCGGVIKGLNDEKS